MIELCNCGSEGTESLDWTVVNTFLECSKFLSDKGLEVLSLSLSHTHTQREKDWWGTSFILISRESPFYFKDLVVNKCKGKYGDTVFKISYHPLIDGMKF